MTPLQQLVPSIPIGTTGKFELIGGLSGAGYVEVLDTFYLKDLDIDEMVSDPAGKLENETEKVMIHDILHLIDQMGYRFATLEEAKIVKSMLNGMCRNSDVNGKNKILLYFVEKEGRIYGLEPFRNEHIKEFEKPSLMERLFDDNYEVDEDDKVAAVCIKK